MLRFKIKGNKMAKNKNNKKSGIKSNKVAIGVSVIESIIDQELKVFADKFKKAAEESYQNYLTKGEIISEVYKHFIKHNFPVTRFELWCRENLGLNAGQACALRRIPMLWGKKKDGVLVPLLPPELVVLVDPEAMINIAKRKTDHECVIWRNAYRRLLVKSRENEYYPGGSVVPWVALKWCNWGERRRAKLRQSRRVFCTTSVAGVFFYIDVKNEDGSIPSKIEALKRAKKALNNCELTAED